VNGLAGFRRGLTIIAHENDKKEMEAALTAGGRGAPPADYLPTQVVTKDAETLKINGVTLTLLHWAPAHTSGDLVVYLPAQKIVFTGDIIVTLRPDPLLHADKNGSSEGWIETAKGIVKLDSDQFVPGHGDLQTKAQVEQRLKLAEEKRAKIQRLVAEGKSLDEVRAAVGDPPPAPSAAGRGGATIPPFTDFVYMELTKKG
jgi:cyclase